MPHSVSAEPIVLEGVALHAHYAGFIRGKVIDNEKMAPGLGFTVSYDGGDQSQCTIYVYRKGLSDIPDGPTSQLVRQEFDQATRDVLALGEYLQGTRVELHSRYGTGTPDRGLEFLCADFSLTDSNGSRRSFAYLTGANNSFVKIRITLTTDDATDATARNFADAVAKRLWKRSIF